MKTFIAKESELNRAWYIIDASGKSLGRVAAKAVTLLRGKNKPTFAYNQETGDYVIIINADKVQVTGNKFKDKTYYRHTGFAGGLKAVTFERLVARHPTQPLELAIKGMLPKGPLGRKLAKNVKIYAGDKHPHAAQAPQTIEV